MASSEYTLATFTMLVSDEALGSIRIDEQFKQLVEEFVVKQMRRHSTVERYALRYQDKASTLAGYREVTWRAVYVGKA